jgi:uncharacterized protein (TIGR03437 family)
MNSASHMGASFTLTHVHARKCLFKRFLRYSIDAVPGRPYRLAAKSRMRRALPLFCALAFCSVAWGQTHTFRVYNAATFLTAKAPESGAAPGSLLLVDLTALSGVWQRDEDTVITLSLRSGTAAESHVLYQGKPDYPIFAVLPPETETGSADLTVSSADGKSSTVRIYVAASNFGQFANTAQEFTEQGPVSNQLTHPAQPGQIVTLWGTGLGNADPAGIVVRVSGVPVTPEFAGHAPEQPGLDQVNFMLPDHPAIPDDCYVPVQVEAAGLVSNTATIAINRGGGACRHPLGLSPSQLVALDRGDSIWLAGAFVEGSVVPVGDGTYFRYDYTELAFTREDSSLIALQSAPYKPLGWRNTCNISRPSLRLFDTPLLPFDLGTVLAQDPTERVVQLKAVSPGTHLFYFSDANVRYSLDQIPQSPFSPGTWSVSTSGGADLDPWQFHFSTPPPMVWTNRNEIKRVTRGEDLTLDWNPDGYDSSDRAWVAALVGVAIPGTDEFRYGGITCDAPATSGRINIPSSLLSMLPGIGQPSSIRLTLGIGRDRESQLLFSVVSRGEAIPGTIIYNFTDTVVLPIE